MKKVTSYQLPVTSYQLPVTSYQLMLLVLFSLFSCASFAQQQNLFSFPNPSEITLSPNESAFVSQKQNSSYIKEVTLVKTKDLKQVQQGGLLNLTIPNDSRTLKVSATSVDFKENGDYEWTGKFENALGYFGIVSTSNFEMAYMHVDGRYFDLYPIRDSIGILLEHNLANYGAEDCGNEIDEITGMKESVMKNVTERSSSSNCGDISCPGTIDVLVLYSDAALGQMFFGPFIPQTLVMQIISQTAVLQTNQALNNSLVFKHPVRLIGVEPLPTTFNSGAFVETSSMNNDLNVIASNLTIGNLKTARRADLVIGFVFNPAYGKTFGISPTAGLGGARQVGEPAPSDLAYALSRIDFFSAPRFTFIHEFGHLMGCEHSTRKNCPGIFSSPPPAGNIANSCGKGLRFSGQTGEHITILGGAEEEEARILHFSNSDVNFDGKPTGRQCSAFWGTSENAKKINSKGCSVSQNEPSPLFTVNIKKERNGACWHSCTPISAEVLPGLIGGGIPPFSFEWRWNYDGNFTSSSTSNFLSNQELVQICGPAAPAPGWNPLYVVNSFWVQLKVTSSDNQVKTATVQEYFASNCAVSNQSKIEAPHSPSYNNTDFTGNKDGFLQTYPNPSTGEFVVELFSAEDEIVILDIVNSEGKKVLHDEKRISEGRLHEVITLDHYPAGIYVIHAKTNTKQFVQKITLIK